MFGKLKAWISSLVLANRKRWLFKHLYRWCDNYGGGLVIATSTDDAREKLAKAYPDRNSFVIWLCSNDDYFDEEHPDVLDIYS